MNLVHVFEGRCGYLVIISLPKLVRQFRKGAYQQLLVPPSALPFI
jgi:hypothetical protein